MQIEIYTATLPLELREAGERFEGVILQEGRAGSSRAEVFHAGLADMGRGRDRNPCRASRPGSGPRDTEQASGRNQSESARKGGARNA